MADWQATEVVLRKRELKALPKVLPKVLKGKGKGKGNDGKAPDESMNDELYQSAFEEGKTDVERAQG